MGQPAARVGDMHVCPMFDGPKPHVGGPVLPPGKPTVLIGGMPAATITDRCVCASVPDIIMQGAQTVLINSMMAARMGDATVHGGRIIVGCPTVLIGGPTFTDISLLRFKPVEVEGISKWDIITSMVLDILPVIGTIKGLIEGINGYDSVTGDKLTTLERAIGWFPILGKLGREIKNTKKLFRIAKKFTKAKRIVNKITLTQDVIKHIFGRHHFTSKAPKAGKFSDIMTEKMLIEKINKTNVLGQRRPNTRGRPGEIIEHDFSPEIIGKNSSGETTTKLRVVVSPEGNVVTAFPY